MCPRSDSLQRRGGEDVPVLSCQERREEEETVVRKTTRGGREMNNSRFHQAMMANGDATARNTHHVFPRVMCYKEEAGRTRQCSRMEGEGWRQDGSGGKSNKTMGLESWEVKWRLSWCRR